MAYFISNKVVISCQCLPLAAALALYTTRPAETLFADNTLQHKPKLFNVLDCIDIHEYVSPSLLLLPLLLLLLLLLLMLVSLFMLLLVQLYYCYVTALLMLLLPKALHCATVPATQFNTKVIT